MKPTHKTGPMAALQSLAARGAVVAINLATGVLTARALRPAGRGELSALILWPVLLSSALALGLPSALIFHVKRRPERAGALLANALLLGLCAGLAATAIGVAAMPRLMGAYDAETVRAAQWMMLHTPLCVFIALGRAALEARGDFAGANATWVFPPLLALAALLVLAATGTLTPVRGALCYVFNGFPVYLWLGARLWKQYGPRFEGGLDSARRLLGYGLRSCGIDLLGTISQQADQALIVGLLPPSAMGAYVVTLSLSRVLLLVQQAVTSVLFPRAAARPVPEVVALAGRAARITAILTASLGAMLALFGQILLRRLYGAEFAPAAGLLRLLVLDAALAGTAMVLAQAFMAVGRPGTVSALQAAGLALGLPLMLTLIPRLGLIGAGIGLACASAARLCLMLGCFPWLLRERPPSLLVGRADVAFLRRKLADAIHPMERAEQG